jgi:D-psicose/D-tagatose/L-ribulose 3-epimerase
VTRTVGIEAFYWLDTWADDQTTVFEKAAASGFDGVEISLVAGIEIDVKGIAEAAKREGVSIACSTGLTRDRDISSPDPVVRAAGVKHLTQSLHHAADLGSPILGGVTYSPWMTFLPGDRSDYRKRSADCLRDLAEVASGLGVTICLEVLNRFEGNMFNTVGECCEFLDEIGHQSVMVEVDTFHMSMEEDDLAQAILLAGARLGHVQVAANNRRAPQFGHIDWKPFKDALDSIGYDGWVVFETFPNPRVETGRSTYAWRNLAVSLDEEARDAAKHIRRYIA